MLQKLIYVRFHPDQSTRNLRKNPMGTSSFAEKEICTLIKVLVPVSTLTALPTLPPISVPEPLFRCRHPHRVLLLQLPPPMLDERSILLTHLISKQIMVEKSSNTNTLVSNNSLSTMPMGTSFPLTCFGIIYNWVLL